MPTSAKKPAASSKSGKKPSPAKKPAASKNTKAASAKNTKKQPVKPVKRDQHREVWVVVTFFLSLLLVFAMLGVNGGILTPMSEFFRGLIGVGAYILPFSVLACCVIIVFAHGKPIAAQITCVMIIPVFIGMLAHLIFSNVVLVEHVIPVLYKTGKTWDSGGVIAGGIAALMAAGINDVLSIILVFICLVYTLLRCANIRIPDIIEFFFGIHEEMQQKRMEREAEEDEDDEEPELPPQPVKSKQKPKPIQEKAPVPVKKSENVSQPSAFKPSETAPKRRMDLIDIPLDKEPVYSKEKPVEPETPRPEASFATGKHEAPASAPVPEKHEAPAAEAVSYAAAPDERVMVLEQNYVRHASSPVPPVFIETLPSAEPDAVSDTFDTAKLPDIRESEPHMLSDEEMLAELTGLDRELTNNYSPEVKNIEPENTEVYPESAEPVYEEPEDPDDFEDEFEELEGEELELSPEPVSAPPAQPAEPVQEPEVLDTHQLVTETADSPIANAPVKASYNFPPIDLLREEEFVAGEDVSEELRLRSHKLADTLQSFGVQAQICNVIRGPSVTRYELLLERGVKISRLTTLQDDIALALGASGVRIAAIPDKSAVGIEVPNKVVQTVYLREVLSSRNMSENKSKLAFALGKDITGASIIGDISKMPHMLIAGTTGSGKSVCINSLIISLIYRSSPEDVRLIMVDPKMVELGVYNGIPHLLVPVVTDYKKAAGALNWAVMEMERRYVRMAEFRVRDLDSYNEIARRTGEEVMPRIVIVIDELADLMMMAAKEIEESVCRIAQKARAAGMHLIIATQRPSADVLTGLMKSNIPSRIAFAVASQIESRIILDQNGAEKLIGRGDMLYFPLGIPKPVRVQGCFVTDSEVETVAEYIKSSGEAQYSQEILDHLERSAADDGGEDVYGDDDDTDGRFDEAVDLVVQLGQASASLLQRKMKLGYSRAGRIIDQMESRGIIGPPDGSKPRQVMLTRTEWSEMKMRRSY